MSSEKRESRKAASATRWPIVAAGLAMQASIGAVFSWNFFYAPTAASGGWEAATVMKPFSLALLLFTVGLMGSVCMRSRWSPRKSATIGGALIVLGCLGSAMAGDDPLGLFTGYSLLGGLGSGLAYLSPSSTLLPRFPDKQGFLATLLALSFGIGVISLGPIADALQGGHLLSASNTSISGDNTEALLLLAAIAAVFVVGGARMLQSYPSASIIGLSPRVSGVRRTVIALRAWFQWSAFFVGVSVGLVTLSDILSTWGFHSNQYTLETAVFGVALMAAGNLLGPKIWASIQNFAGRIVALTLVLLVAAVLAFVVTGGTASSAQLLAMVSLVGFGAGGFLGVMPTLRSEMFAGDNLVATIALMFSANGLSGQLASAWTGTIPILGIGSALLPSIGAILILGFLYLLFRPIWRTRLDIA